MRNFRLCFLFFFISVLAINGVAQTGPWAKYDAQMKGEALVRESDGGYLDEVKSIVAGGGDVNWQLQPTGLTPLMAAASNNRAEVVRYLLNNGANVSMKDANGRTALDRARMFGANEVIKVINEYLQKHQEAKEDKTPVKENKEDKKESPAQTPVIPVPVMNQGNNEWPVLGTYQPEDSVLFFAGSWKKGTIKEVGKIYDGSNKNAVPSELKYLIAPDAYANWPDWADWSMVAGLHREPFWTKWFVGDWLAGEVMAVTTRTEGAYERNEYNYAEADQALRINADGTYNWKRSKNEVITGKWKAAKDGPGVVLLKGYKGLDWTVRNESTATELHIRHLEKARLYPSSESVMTISLKRKKK